VYVFHIGNYANKMVCFIGASCFVPHGVDMADSGLGGAALYLRLPRPRGENVVQHD